VSLGIPHGGPCFTFSADIFDTSPPSAVPGISFTTSASANTDGTAVTVLSALARDAHYLVLAFMSTTSTSADPAVMADILIDPAGGTSWASLIDDLLIGGCATAATGLGPNLYFHFPLWIPAGASIGIQARRSHAAALTGRVMAWVYGEPKRPDQWWCGQKVESLGTNPATSKGTAHTPGTLGVYSSWATIATSTKRYGALQFSVGGTDASPTDATSFWQVGVGSTQLPGSPTLMTQTSSRVLRGGWQQPWWCDLPAGTALQTRALTSVNPAESHDVAFYGVY
jgi:hypothetical protein